MPNRSCEFSLCVRRNVAAVAGARLRRLLTYSFAFAFPVTSIKKGPKYHPVVRAGSDWRP
jgi:hypothetical protein